MPDSIFKKGDPPFGTYYITDSNKPAFNALVNVNKDRIIFEYDYNGYDNIEVTKEPVFGSYNTVYKEYKFENIQMKKYIVDIKFRYKDDDNHVLLVYKNLVSAEVLFELPFSGKVNEIPSGFVKPINSFASISPTISIPSATPSTPSTPSTPCAPCAPCALCTPCAPCTPTIAPNPVCKPEKSFFDKYFIYILIFTLLIIISLVGVYFFIKKYTPTNDL
jgi:hypothetical protein